MRSKSAKEQGDEKELKTPAEALAESLVLHLQLLLLASDIYSHLNGTQLRQAPLYTDRDTQAVDLTSHKIRTRTWIK